MKRLLTYLGLLATLLAMPYHAKAETWAYYLYGDINGWDKTNAMTKAYKFGDTSNRSDNITWTKTFTGDQLDPDGNGEALFKILLDKDGTNTNLGPSGSDQGLEVNGSAQTLNNGGDKAYKVTGIKPAAEYTIMYKSTTRYGGTISIIGPATANENLKLGGDFEGWNGNEGYDDFSEDGIYTWDFTTTEFPDGTKFKLCDKGTNTWYSNGAVVTEDWSSEFSGGGQMGYEMSVSYSDNDLIKISVQAMKSGNGWKIRIVKTKEPHDYYWVSPQITNGEMWPAFKMVASRNRYWSGSAVIGDGKISNKYYTFTIKDDDLVRWRTKNKIEKDQPIQWYILRDDGEVVYRPKSDLDENYKPHNNVDYDTNHPISGNTDNDGYVSFINYWNGNGYGGDGAYMTTAAPHNTGSWKFLKGSAKAHTFNLNAEKGHVLYNYTNKGALTNKGYYLVGNWTADTKASIHLSEGKLMTKYWFKEGVGSKTEVADADSIVYKIDITKKALGIESWGGLYLDISPSDNGTSDNDTNWGKVFRPLITTGNNLDGRALHGALTTRKDEQSLNPETSENYLGYTFSFNATTMTYRLEFHTPDATLKPGTMDGNLNFMNSTSETINVNFSNASDGIHTTATKYSIAFGDKEDITLNDTKYIEPSFKLRYDGTNIYKDDDTTTPLATGNTVYVKIKGWDDDNNYGDVHTYQYTFFSPLTFEPKGGLFINSAKIKIQGGAKPYTWRVYKYETKKDEVSGDDVLYLHTVRSSGEFDGDYKDGAQEDGNYRISTPGILEIEDANHNKVISDEKNLFDFTYSTSENYDINNNGEDYWKAAPGDRSNKLDLTWRNATMTDEEEVSHWSGGNGVIKHIKKDQYPLTQTVAGLDKDKTYTVQAIVRGLGENKATATLTVVGATTGTETIDLRNGSGGGEGSDEAANLSRKGNVVNKYGRVEYIEPMETEFTQKVASVGWAKVEAAAKPTSEGKLTIKLESSGDWFNLSNVTLLESANTTEGFRTTASATATSVDESTVSKGFDFRARDISSTWKKNNAYSFFDRGKNRNAVIYANYHTVIAMNPDLLADVPQNNALKAVDRRHPFNVVGSDENDSNPGTAKALYLTDMGYGGNTTDYPGDADNPVDYDQTGNITGYSRSGYTFIPKFPLKAQDVIFDRQLGGETYKNQTTIMLPFGITVTELKKYYGDNVKVWKYNGCSLAKKTILFTEVTGTTEANTPYILTGANGKLDSRKLISGDKSVKEVAATQNIEQHTAISDGGFTGSYAYQTIDRTTTINGTTLTHFAFNPTTGKFQVIHKNGAAMKPFRAYFSVPVVIEENNNAPAFTVIFDDTTTGISESVQVNVEPTNVYTLGGVLVARNGDLSRLPKGVYIVNGKKVIK